MSGVSFDLRMGEVSAENSANLSNSQPFTAKKCINMYYSNGYMRFRPSTRKVSTIPLPTGYTVGEVHVDAYRKWIIVPVIDSSLGVTFNVIKGVLSAPQGEQLEYESITQANLVDADGTPRASSMLLTAANIAYYQLNSQLINRTLNPTTGDSAILCFGLDKIYYIDDTATAKEFKITRASGSSSFPNPVYGELHQGRLYIMGEGVRLSDGSSFAKSPQNVFGSCIINTTSGYTADNFTPIADPVDASEGGFTLQLLTEINEKLYGFQEFLSKLVITSSYGIRTFGSSTTEDKRINSSSATYQKTGVVPSNPSPPVLHDGIILYPSVIGLRQQQVQAIMYEMESIFDNKCTALQAFVPTHLYHDVARGIILARTDEGKVKSMYWAKQPGGILSFTTYYDSDYRPCVRAARTTSSVYDFLILKSEDGTEAYVAQETDEIGCRELIQNWAPKATVTVANVAGGVNVTVTSYTDMRASKHMSGLYFQTSANVWKFATRTTQGGSVFFLKGGGLAAGTHMVFPKTTDLAQQLPESALKSDNSTEGIRVDIFVGGNQTVSSVHSPLQFHESVLNNEIIIELSYWFKDPGIEWYTGPAYPGAQISSIHYNLIVSKETGENFEVLSGDSTAPLSNNSVAFEDYYSYKFSTNASISYNTSKISFRNKGVAKDGSIFQLYAIPG